MRVPRARGSSLGLARSLIVGAKKTVPEPASAERLSLSAYARRRGVTLRAVQNAIKDGRIARETDGKIDPEKADAEWRAATSPARGGDRRSPRAASGPSALGDARAKREKYLAELARLKYELESGRLLDAREVEKAWFDKARIVRDAILNLPDRVAPLVASETDEHKVHRILTDELRSALEELADAAGR